MFLTEAAIDALEVEYDPTATTSQTLYIPEVNIRLPPAPPISLTISYQNQFQDCDILGIRWLYADTARSNKFVTFLSLIWVLFLRTTLRSWMGLVGASSRPENGALQQDFGGHLLTNTWKISSTADGRGLRQLFGANGSGTLL